MFYLDSFDVDWRYPYPSAVHHLKELTAINKILYENMFFDIDTKIARYYEVTDFIGTDKKENTRYMSKWNSDFGSFNNIIKSK